MLVAEIAIMAHLKLAQVQAQLEAVEAAQTQVAQVQVIEHETEAPHIHTIEAHECGCCGEMTEYELYVMDDTGAEYVAICPYCAYYFNETEPENCNFISDINLNEWSERPYEY